MEEKHYIEFDSYLANELSKADLLNFKLNLKTDPEFLKAFETYKDLHGFLEHKFENETEFDDFKGNLKKISESHFSKSKNDDSQIRSASKAFNFYKYAIAASILLFLGIFAFNQFSKPSYADYANYSTISLTVRGNNNDLLKIAESTFNNKAFEKADAAFKRLIELDENNAELKLYRAIANIELSNYEIAEALLEELKVGDSAFKNKAIWYLALGKLKQKDTAACVSILKTLTEDAQDYKRAQKLLNKLD